VFIQVHDEEDFHSLVNDAKEFDVLWCPRILNKYDESNFMFEYLVCNLR